MTRRKGTENDKLPIPDDWVEADGYRLAITCVPDSRQWRAVWNGLISGLAYGRNWNRSSGTITDVQVIARQIYEDMDMACLDDLIEALACYCDSNTEIAAQTAALVELVAGQAAESPGPVSQPEDFGEGETWPTTEAYFDAKCNAANAIFDTLREVFVALDANSVDILAGLFGSVTTGIMTMFIGAGPVGWAMVLTASIVGIVSGYVIRYTLDFSDVVDALDDVHCDAVNALYDSGTAETANSAFMAVLAGATSPPTAIESALVDILLNVTMLNQLFEPREDVAIYESDDPCECTPIEDTLFEMSPTSPYNTLVDGTFSAQSATAFNDSAGYHLPNPGDWVEFIVVPDTGSVVAKWNSWESSGELYLTATPVNGYIKFFISDMIQASGSFEVKVFEWPQTVDEWGDGESIEAAGFEDQGGGTKPATATLRITSGDGSQIIRKLKVSWIGEL